MGINSISGSALRLTGLASGMDTESLVTALLTIDKYKYDKQYKVKAKLEFKADAYKDFNLKLRTFREKYMSVLSPETNVFGDSALNAYKVNMDASSAVSVTAGSNALAGSYTINSIDKLATSAKASSSGIYKDPTAPISLDAKLKDVVFNNLLTPQKVDGNGPVVELDENGVPILDDDGNEIPVMEENFSFIIDDGEKRELFEFTIENTLNEVITEVNRRGLNVTMSYSALTKGLSITSKSTGADSKFEIINVEGNAFAANEADAAFGIKEGLETGVDAELYINNTLVKRSSNNFTIDGISYSLKAKTTDSVSFSVDRDIEPALNKIKSFISAYNSLVEDLQAAYNQRPNRSYDPLTDEERGSLTEKEVEKWEGLAKEGLLYRDNNIASILSSMRGSFYAEVGGTNRTPSDIGLRTSSTLADGKLGKIEINEEALRAALSNDPQRVTDIMTKISYKEDGTTIDYENSGLVTRLYSAINTHMSNVSNVSLATVERQITSANDRLTQLQSWLEKREAMHWARFTAMETAMSNLNSQTSYITSMLAQSSASK